MKHRTLQYLDSLKTIAVSSMTTLIATIVQPNEDLDC